MVELIQFQDDRLGHHLGKQGAAVLQDFIPIRTIYQESDLYCFKPDGTVDEKWQWAAPLPFAFIFDT